MTGLGRFFGSRDDVPEWARFFTPDDYRAFLTAVDGDLRRRGVAVELDEGTVRARIPGRPEAADFGLLNLAQTCHLAGRGDWPAAIREHFDSALSSTKESDELDRLAVRLDDVRASIKVRLYHPDYRDQAGGASIVHRDLAEGIVETLVYDLPSSVRTVPTEHVARWGVPPDELFRLGLDNVRREPSPGVQVFGKDEDAPIHALVGNSFFTASRVLFLDAVLPPSVPLGSLVAIPHRHAVIFHPIVDLRAVAATRAMIPMAFGMFQEGPGSISPHLYWWRGGRFTTLPSKVTSQSISFSPPDDFVDLLNSLSDP